jgi:hypothetical protein
MIVPAVPPKMLCQSLIVVLSTSMALMLGGAVATRIRIFVRHAVDETDTTRAVGNLCAAAEHL